MQRSNRTHLSVDELGDVLLHALAECEGDALALALREHALVDEVVLDLEDSLLQALGAALLARGSVLVNFEAESGIVVSSGRGDAGQYGSRHGQRRSRTGTHCTC